MNVEGLAIFPEWTLVPAVVPLRSRLDLQALMAQTA